MKKFSALVLTSIIAISTVACVNRNETASTNITEKIGGEITVSCFESALYKNYLEEAAKAFEKKYPGTKVNIETFSLMPEVKTSATEDGRKASVITIGNDDDMSKIDYINKINTELMSGGGADLLAMDVLPYYKYAEKGQLEDLKKYMEEDQEFIPSNYLQNIVDAVQYKGRQYLFPISYSFQYLSYDTTLLDKKAQDQLAQKDTFTYEELTEIAYNSFQNQKKTRKYFKNV